MRISVVAASVAIVIIIIAAGFFSISELGIQSNTSAITTSNTTTGFPNTTVVTTRTAKPGSNITIGMTVSETGKYAPLVSGYTYLNEAWQNWTNSIGGLVDANGTHHYVNVVTLNDNSTPPGAITSYTQLAKNKSNVLIAPDPALLAAKVAPIAQQNQIPMIVGAGATPSIFTNNSWIVSPVGPYWNTTWSEAWSSGYFTLLNKTKWAKSIAIIGLNDTQDHTIYNSSLWLANKTSGLKVVYHDLLYPNSTGNYTFTNDIAKLTSLKPDIVYLAMDSFDAAQFIVKANASGFKPMQWHTSVLPFKKVIQAAGISPNNLTSEVPWVPSMTFVYHAGQNYFHYVLEQAGNLSTKAGATNATAVNYANYPYIGLRWIMFQVLNETVQQLPSSAFNSTTQLGKAMIKEMHMLKSVGITGAFAIGPTGVGNLDPPFAVQFQNNSLDAIAPIEVANTSYSFPLSVLPKNVTTATTNSSQTTSVNVTITTTAVNSTSTTNTTKT